MNKEDLGKNKRGIKEEAQKANSKARVKHMKYRKKILELEKRLRKVMNKK